MCHDLFWLWMWKIIHFICPYKMRTRLIANECIQMLRVSPFQTGMIDSVNTLFMLEDAFVRLHLCFCVYLADT